MSVYPLLLLPSSQLVALLMGGGDVQYNMQNPSSKLQGSFFILKLQLKGKQGNNYKN